MKIVFLRSTMTSILRVSVSVLVFLMSTFSIMAQNTANHSKENSSSSRASFSPRANQRDLAAEEKKDEKKKDERSADYRKSLEEEFDDAAKGAHGNANKYNELKQSALKKYDQQNPTQDEIKKYRSDAIEDARKRIYGVSDADFSNGQKYKPEELSKMRKEAFDKETTAINSLPDAHLGDSIKRKGLEDEFRKLDMLAYFDKRANMDGATDATKRFYSGLRDETLKKYDAFQLNQDQLGKLKRLGVYSGMSDAEILSDLRERNAMTFASNEENKHYAPMKKAWQEKLSAMRAVDGGSHSPFANKSSAEIYNFIRSVKDLNPAGDESLGFDYRNTKLYNNTTQVARSSGGRILDDTAITSFYGGPLGNLDPAKLNNSAWQNKWNARFGRRARTAGDYDGRIDWNLGHMAIMRQAEGGAWALFDKQNRKVGHVEYLSDGRGGHHDFIRVTGERFSKEKNVPLGYLIDSGGKIYNQRGQFVGVMHRGNAFIPDGVPDTKEPEYNPYL